MWKQNLITSKKIQNKSRLFFCKEKAWKEQLFFQQIQQTDQVLPSIVVDSSMGIMLISLRLFCPKSHYIEVAQKGVSSRARHCEYLAIRMRPIITHFWFKTTFDYKPQILSIRKVLASTCINEGKNLKKKRTRELLSCS